MESKQKKKKLWLITNPFYPDEVSTGYYLTGIAEELVKLGFSVSVICGQSNYFTKKLSPVHEERNGVEIFRCWSPRWERKRLRTRIISMFLFSLAASWEIIKRVSSKDLVVTITSPPALPFFVGIACKLKAINCVLITHDIYPDVLVAANFFNKQSLIIRFLTNITNKIYKLFSKIIVIGRDMKEVIAEKVKSSEQIEIITNWSDTKEVYPLAKEENEILKEIDATRKFIIQYSGNMGPLHDVESLLKCAELLKNYNHIHFVVFTFGSKREEFQEEVKKRNLNNISILDSRPRKDSLIFLNACDVILSLFVPGMYGLAVPSRIYNAMAAGKPLIAMCDNNSEIALTINENKIGWVIKPTDYKKMAEVILEASKNTFLVEEMSINSRRVAEVKFSKEIIINKYKEVFQALY